MQQERETIHRRLKDELSEVYFDQTDLVLQRTHPRTWGQRIRMLWNREIELPLVPIGLAAAFLIGIAIFQQGADPQQGDPLTPRQMVEAGGNIYWADAYEKAVSSREN